MTFKWLLLRLRASHGDFMCLARLDLLLRPAQNLSLEVCAEELRVVTGLDLPQEFLSNQRGCLGAVAASPRSFVGFARHALFLDLVILRVLQLEDGRLELLRGCPLYLDVAALLQRGQLVGELFCDALGRGRDFRGDVEAQGALLLR